MPPAQPPAAQSLAAQTPQAQAPQAQTSSARFPSAAHNIDYGADFGTAPPVGVTEFVTAGGIAVSRTAMPFEPGLLAQITRQVDQRRGGIFSSGMEYPDRYSRWQFGYVDPPIELT